MRPALLMTEAMNAIFTTKEHPDYIAALARRGITDLDAVQIDPWPAGSFGYDAEDGRRIARCISFLRHDATDNGYARPIEGLIVHFDMGGNEVIEVIDHGVTPLPPNRASYYAEDQPSLRAGPQADLDHATRRPELHRRRQPRAVAKWQFRVGFDPYEGLVLHQITYDDDGRAAFGAAPRVDQRDGRALRRPRRAAGLEERVRRGRVGARPHDAAAHARLRLRRRDPLLRRDARERAGRAVGRSRTRSACTRRTTGSSGSTSTCTAGAARCAAAGGSSSASVATVGNYEYGFFWYFYLDGNIQLEVKLTGIVSPMAIEPGTQPEFANVIGDGVAAPHHQHLFNARLDFDVDGPVNDVYEVEAERVPPGPDNPWGNAFRQRSDAPRHRSRRAARHRLRVVARAGRSSTRTCATASG